jgi:hypothetical protein
MVGFRFVASASFFASFGLCACVHHGADIKQEVSTNAPSSDAPECGPGTMPSLALGTCVAVGPTIVPKGFARAHDGWGVLALRPADGCTGAKRAVLGQTACVPIDNCGAPFPPPEASVVVRPGGGVTLREAIATAKRGATIAVDSGTYEVVEKPAFATPPDVRVVGRCAAEVKIHGLPENTAFGFSIGKLFLSGVTLSGFGVAIEMDSAATQAEFRNVFFDHNAAAIRADHGAKVVVENSVVDGGHANVTFEDLDQETKAFVVLRGSQLRIRESEIRDTDRAFTALGADSQINAARVFVRSRTTAPTLAALAMHDAHIAIDESFISVQGTHMFGLGQSQRNAKTSRDTASLRVHSSELFQDGAYLDRPLIAADGGVSLEVEESTIHYNAYSLLGIGDGGTRGTLKHVVARSNGVEGQERNGATALFGASLEVTGSAFLGACGIGVSSSGQGTRLSMVDSLVRDTTSASPQSDKAARLSYGGYIGHGATGTVTASAFVNNERTAFALATGARAELDRVIVDHTRASKQDKGAGILLLTDTHLRMTDSVVQRSAGLGMNVLRASAVVERTRWSQNAGAIGVWETAWRNGAPNDRPNDREVVLVANEFVDTGAEVAPSTNDRDVSTP